MLSAINENGVCLFKSSRLNYNINNDYILIDSVFTKTLKLLFERTKMYFKLFVFLILFSTFSISCQSKTEQASQEKLNPNTHKVIVEEVLPGKSYTYLRVKEKDNEHWLAISKREVKEGEILYYNSGLAMKGFESKEINKIFETIYFIDEISNTPLESKIETLTTPGNRKNKQKEEISVSKAKDGISIAELFSKKEDYSAKRVIIKGQVVKFNSQIMGKNWVHLQDGTKDGNNFDLTVTTKDSVKVGDVVTFSGIVTLNKNLGAGYSYDVIMEEAKLASK